MTMTTIMAIAIMLKLKSQNTMNITTSLKDQKGQKRSLRGLSDLKDPNPNAATLCTSAKRTRSSIPRAVIVSASERHHQRVAALVKAGTTPFVDVSVQLSRNVLHQSAGITRPASVAVRRPNMALSSVQAFKNFARIHAAAAAHTRSAKTPAQAHSSGTARLANANAVTTHQLTAQEISAITRKNASVFASRVKASVRQLSSASITSLALAAASRVSLLLHAQATPCGTMTNVLASALTRSSSLRSHALKVKNSIIICASAVVLRRSPKRAAQMAPHGLI